MTAKLNLAPLINYFSDKNSTIAGRLSNLTKTSNKDEQSLEKSITKSEEQIKNLESKLKDAQDKEERTALWLKIETQEKEIEKLEDKLSSTKNKSASASKKNLNKIAQTLIEIADELDATDPELAVEADSILQDLLKQAGCSNMMMSPDHVHSEECMDGSAAVVSPMMMDEESEAEMGMSSEPKIISIEELTDPDISEPSEPEPEFDEVSLEDLDDRLSGLKWRIADRHRREALEKAKEHAAKAKEYYDAFKRYKEKTHGIFDEAGEALRLKDFE